MAIEILMPALSPTMTEGTLAKWLKREGEEIRAGDVLAEIETDKATMEFEAVDEGRLGKILVAAGTPGVAINQPIAVLLEEGENAPPALAPAPAPVERGDRIFASPLARRLAAEAGLDLAGVRGSGPQGRIVKSDVEAAVKTPSPSPVPAPAKAVAPSAPSAPPPVAKPVAGLDAKEYSDKLGLRYRAVPNSGMRKTIARRLTEAKQSVPHFYLTIDCRLDDLLRVRQELNGRSEDYKLSVNDFVARAVALGLKKVPAANAAWTDEAILMYEHVDLSVAVATPGGLITPIIKNADQKGLAQISNEMKDLARRARDGKLKPEEYLGGTFSISNLGMYGVRQFEAIINPPQGCILAVGAGAKRPVVIDDALAIATMMSCTLSVDHRVVDGAVGAEFMAAFKKLIEDPLTMLL